MQSIERLWFREVCDPLDGIRTAAAEGLKTLNELQVAGGTINPMVFINSADTMNTLIKKAEAGIATTEAALATRKEEIKEERKEETKKEVAVADSLCFIATAAYGSPMAEEIAVLHMFRDEFLMKSTGGKAFIAFYYLASPPVAKYISEHEILRIIVREGIVDPIASVVEKTVDWWTK
jgi:hypothetical protein